MRTDQNRNVQRPRLQFNRHAEPRRQRTPTGGRLHVENVRTVDTVRLQCTIEIIPVRRLCANVYGKGAESDRPVPESVRECAVALLPRVAGVRIPVAGRVELYALPGGEQSRSHVYGGAARTGGG